ncbi:hypothetical protein WSM22_36420 [Cytophagales bacterium WSM2-2]|nr:hypothetical protein WSM22_36420 [Cytophagales bacterium WSM2-2]
MNQPTGHFVKKILLRQTIGSVRLVIALFTIGAAVIKLLYNRFLPGLNDLDGLRWTIIGLGCVFFVTTFIRYRRGTVVTYFSFFLYLLTILYLLAFVAINRFDPNASIILLLVLGISTVVFQSLFYYSMQSLLILAVALFVLLNYKLSNESLMALLTLAIAVGAFGIVTAVRLQLISKIGNSHANLEMLNVLSIVANKRGEITFVSPSAYFLLGYRPEELVKERWWELPNLREGWIDRDYILNYPNILPKEIVSMETSITTKDGKTVWLSWINSMLPNGNYMGVALDVTKYKSAN